MTKVLITGGAGFIGSHLTERAARAGATRCSWSTTSRPPPRQPATPHERLTVVERDDRRRDARRARLRARSAPRSWCTPPPPTRTRRPGPRTPHERRRHRQRRAGRRAGRRESRSSTSRRRSATASSRWSSRSRSAIRCARRTPATRSRRRRASTTSGSAAPRLGLVPPGQRLRAAQPQRAAADVLPAADARQAVLRHGHAPRLRLRRRPRRRCVDARVDGAGRAGAYHVSSGSRLLDPGAVRRDDRGARACSSTRRRGAPAQRGRRASRSCSTPR